MLRYQIKTSQTVKDKIAAVGGERSIAYWILHGVKWRLGHESCPKESHLLDEERKIRVIASEKKLATHPIVVVTYQIITGFDDFYDMEITDIFIIP